MASVRAYTILISFLLLLAFFVVDSSSKSNSGSESSFPRVQPKYPKRLSVFGSGSHHSHGSHDGGPPRGTAAEPLT